MPFLTKDTFTFDFAIQADYPNWTPTQTKQNFNARTEELRLALNAVVNILNATTSGASGAKNLAMTPIASFGTQANVQDVVEALILRLQAVTASLSGAKFIGVETIAGLTGNDVQTLLATLKIAIDNVALGAIPDGSLTDIKLSNTAGQIKDTVAAHQAETMSYEGKKFTINNPYKSGGSLNLKGQMHCHTLNSDGADTPTALVTAYRDAGYAFMTITDHNFITPDPVVAGMTWLGNSVEDTYLRHVIGYDVLVQGVDQDLKGIIAFYHNAGKLVSIPHPNWTGVYVLTPEEIKYVNGFNFIECFNNLTGGFSENQWDYALSASRKVFGLATDDCHSVTNPAWFNKGWVVVHTDVNDKASIQAALKSGNFYSSTGNDITTNLVGKMLTATSTVLSNISFIGKNGTVLQTNNNVISASYAIQGDEMYVRVRSVKVSDALAFAWSQPVFIELVGNDDVLVFDKDANTRKSIEGGGFGIDLATYKTNVKQIANCEADEGWVNNAWWGATGTYSADMVNFKTGLASAKLTGIANTTGISLVKTLDLTKFDDGSDSLTTDYISFVIYIDQANLDLMPVNGIGLSFPCDVKPTYTNYLVKGVLKSALVAGYNFIKLNKSLFAAVGAGSFATIKGVYVYINGTPTASASFSVDNIQLVRKDPLVDVPNPFQTKEGVYNRAFEVIDGEWFVGEEFLDVICRNINPANSKMSLRGVVPFADFKSSSVVVTRGAYAFGHSVGLSATNCIRAYIDSSTIYLESYRIGVAEISKTLIMSSPVVSGDTVRFEIIRKGKNVTLNVYKNSEPKPYTITAETSLTELFFLGVQSAGVAPQDIKHIEITGTGYADKSNEAYMARTVVQKEKAGAFTAIELNKNEFGVDTLNHRLYIKYASGAVKYSSLL